MKHLYSLLEEFSIRMDDEDDFDRSREFDLNDESDDEFDFDFDAEKSEKSDVDFDFDFDSGSLDFERGSGRFDMDAKDDSFENELSSRSRPRFDDSEEDLPRGLSDVDDDDGEFAGERKVDITDRLKQLLGSKNRDHSDEIERPKERSPRLSDFDDI